MLVINILIGNSIKVSKYVAQASKYWSTYASMYRRHMRS